MPLSVLAIIALAVLVAMATAPQKETRKDKPMQNAQNEIEIWKSLTSDKRKKLIKVCCDLWRMRQRLKLSDAGRRMIQDIRDGYWVHMSRHDMVRPTVSFNEKLQTVDFTWSISAGLITAQLDDVQMKLLVFSMHDGSETESVVRVGPPLVHDYHRAWEAINRAYSLLVKGHHVVIEGDYEMEDDDEDLAE